MTTQDHPRDGRGLQSLSSKGGLMAFFGLFFCAGFLILLININKILNKENHVLGIIIIILLLIGSTILTYFGFVELKKEKEEKIDGLIKYGYKHN